MLLQSNFDWIFLTKVLLLIIIAAYAVANFIGRGKDSDMEGDGFNEPKPQEPIE